MPLIATPAQVLGATHDRSAMFDGNGLPAYLRARRVMLDLGLLRRDDFGLMVLTEAGREALARECV